MSRSAPTSAVHVPGRGWSSVARYWVGRSWPRVEASWWLVTRSLRPLLTEHRADRRAVGALVLAAAGIDAGAANQMAADQTLPDGTPRYVGADVDPGEVDYVASLWQANRWQQQFDEARHVASERGSPPVEGPSAPDHMMGESNGRH